MKILAQRDILSVPMPFIVLDIAAGLGPLVAALAVTSAAIPVWTAHPAGTETVVAAVLWLVAVWRPPDRWSMRLVGDREPTEGRDDGHTCNTRHG